MLEKLLTPNILSFLCTPLAILRISSLLSIDVNLTEKFAALSLGFFFFFCINCLDFLYCTPVYVLFHLLAKYHIFYFSVVEDQS